MPGAPRPVAPVYEPEVAARAIVTALSVALAVGLLAVFARRKGRYGQG